MYICDILLQQWHKCYGTNQPLHEMESTFDNVNKAKNLKLDRLCVHVWLWFGSFFFVFIFIMRERKLIWWVEKGEGSRRTWEKGKNDKNIFYEKTLKIKN